jgi:hypothetical protein
MPSGASDGRPAFVVWEQPAIDGACEVGDLTGVPDDFELIFAVPRAATFPADATLAMDLDYPNDTILTDSLFNTSLLRVGSAPLQELLAGWPVQHIEYLPVTILDHRRKVVKAPYFILHPVGLVDCVDPAASGAVPSALDPDVILVMDRLVIDEAKVPPDRSLFRPASFPRMVLARRDLAEAIDRAGLTGIRWVELADYPEH